MLHDFAVIYRRQKSEEDLTVIPNHYFFLAKKILATSRTLLFSLKPYTNQPYEETHILKTFMPPRRRSICDSGW